MRRALTCLLSVAGLALLAPAASAQSLDDGLSEAECRDAGGNRALCVGLGKLGERVSAECRRLGALDDASCWSRVGRRVLREEVEAYQGSWTQRTLAFQRALSDGVPFADAPFVGTHNSFNDVAEEPTLSHTDSNQQLSLRDQLRLDVRSLEIDVHWIPSARAGGDFAPVVCHGQGPVGCSTERLLSERLPEVVRWLDEHSDEVIFLYLEDQIDDAAGYEASAKVVADALGDRLYRPRGGGCQNLPLSLSRQAVRDSGAQVVVVGDCGQGAWQSVSHAWPDSVRYESRPRNFSCSSIPADAQSKIVRFFEDSTFVSAGAERTGLSSTDDGLTPATVRAMAGCGVDHFGFDQLLPRDGRLDALVWSWADGQPRAGACTIQRSDGRWETRSCEEKHAPACTDAGGGAVQVLDGAVKAHAAGRRCADLGLVLATPRTGTQNAAIRAAAGARSVWLAHRQG